MKYPPFCTKCLRVFSAPGPRNVHQTQCLKNLNVQRKELKVSLQRAKLPPPSSAPASDDEDEDVEVVDVSEEDDNKENIVGARRCAASKSGANDASSESRGDEIGCGATTVIIVDEDEISFKGGKDSGYGGERGGDDSDDQEPGGDTSSGEDGGANGKKKRGRPAKPRAPSPVFVVSNNGVKRGTKRGATESYEAGKMDSEESKGCRGKATASPPTKTARSSASAQGGAVRNSAKASPGPSSVKGRLGRPK